MTQMKRCLSFLQWVLVEMIYETREILGMHGTGVTRSLVSADCVRSQPQSLYQKDVRLRSPYRCNIVLQPHIGINEQSVLSRKRAKKRTSISHLNQACRHHLELHCLPRYLIVHLGDARPSDRCLSVFCVITKLAACSLQRQSLVATRTWQNMARRAVVLSLPLGR